MKPRFLARLQSCTGDLSRNSLVELTGNNRVLIENHSGVLAYSLEEIQVKVSYGKLVIRGRMLQLMQMNSEQLVINGLIDTLQPLGGKL